ncbi:hypothetical protein QTL86_09075 [Cellulosilyticum sp. ST5]|uniref:hypothetical protein n=1 Tax=Cellulosilyticum sp. ST5 TaxID=3055805 RepID=UPI003977730E
MQLKRISISISQQLKGQLEQLAKINYRTLNGEINKALDFYILSQGEGIAVQKDILPTPNSTNETSSRTQTEAPVHQNTLNNNQYDEIEEF